MCALLTKDGRIFVHIPKNAGKLARQILKNRPDNVECELFGLGESLHSPHMKIDMAHLHFPDTLLMFPEFERYDSFCIVRNPYARFVVGFDYCKREEHVKSVIRAENHSHESFLEQFDPELEIYTATQVHMAPQHKFVYHRGRCMVTRVMHYESISDESFKHAGFDTCGVGKVFHHREGHKEDWTCTTEWFDPKRHLATSIADLPDHDYGKDAGMALYEW